jgi:hypothetical protein
MKLNYSLDYRCKTRSTDVTENEFTTITECIAENDFKNYLEVGVWHGATLYSIVNLFKLNGIELDAYGYDCFDEGVSSDVPNSHTSGWPSKQEVEAIFKDFPNVKLIAGDTSKIDTVLSDKKFDFVFHDANHTREAIVSDLITLKKI